VPITPLVIPAKAGIQYSRDSDDEPGSRGVLGRPVSPGDDSCGGVAGAPTLRRALLFLIQFSNSKAKKRLDTGR
jgi:hypothetical protein